MKYLALGLLLCALASLSNAQCYQKKPMTPGVTRCQDDVDMTWHDVGTEWRNSECMDCTCGGCCAGFSTPRIFPDDCESVFDSNACAFVVHKKGDPSVLCPIFGGVGK